MIDITTMEELPDPLNFVPDLGAAKPKSNKYLWIIILLLVALFAILWYFATKEGNEKQDNR